MSKNYSTWRRDDIEVKAGETKQFAFYDTKPNLFYIQNVNATDIYIGLQYLPTVEKYEFRIEQNSYDTVGRPLACQYINILNPSNNDIVVTVYSVSDVFEISILKNYALAINELTLDSKIEFKDGVSLPTGNNLIGKVGINGSIPAGNNSIGKVEMGSSMLRYYDNYIKSYIANLITAVGDSNVFLSSVNEVIKKLISLELTTSDKMVTKTGTSSITLSLGLEENAEFTKVITLCNDGCDIYATFKNSSGTEVAKYTIKSGEIFEKILITDEVHYITISAVTSGEKYETRIIGR